MSSSARRIRTSPYHWKEHQKEDSAAQAAGSFAHGGKGTKTPFLCGAPSACSLNRRAKPEWPTPLLPGHWALAGRKFGLGVSTWSAWFVSCCLVGPRMRADETSAPTPSSTEICRGRCPHRPVQLFQVPSVGAAFRRPPNSNQPLRLVATGALFSSSPPDFRPKSSQRQRRGSGGNQLHHPRRIRGMTSRQASLVTGVRGRATGVRALPGAQPPAILSCLSDRSERHTPSWSITQVLIVTLLPKW